jgi:hypothetical protein
MLARQLDGPRRFSGSYGAEHEMDASCAGLFALPSGLSDI